MEAHFDVPATIHPVSTNIFCTLFLAWLEFSQESLFNFWIDHGRVLCMSCALLICGFLVAKWKYSGKCDTYADIFISSPSCYIFILLCQYCGICIILGFFTDLLDTEYSVVVLCSSANVQLEASCFLISSPSCYIFILLCQYCGICILHRSTWHWA